MLFLGRIYIALGPWYFGDYRNIFQPYIVEDQKKVLPSKRGTFGTVPSEPQPKGTRDGVPQTKLSPSQTAQYVPQIAHNSAKYAKIFPLRQFQDVDSMTFFSFLFWRPTENSEKNRPSGCDDLFFFFFFLRSAATC